MPVPAGLVRLSDAANRRNLKGDISNGAYGTDWVQTTASGGDVGEGAWNESNIGYARPDIAARLEAAAGAGAPAASPAPAPAAGGGGSEMPPISPAMPSAMGALQATAQNFEELSSGSALNPNLGTRLQPSAMKALSMMAGRNY